MKTSPWLPSPGPRSVNNAAFAERQLKAGRSGVFECLHSLFMVGVGVGGAKGQKCGVWGWRARAAGEGVGWRELPLLSSQRPVSFRSPGEAEAEARRGCSLPGVSRQLLGWAVRGRNSQHSRLGVTALQILPNVTGGGE